MITLSLDVDPVCSKSNSFGIMLNLGNEIY